MNRCKRCVMPDTRPDTEFVDGVCSACLSYEKRKRIDWKAREDEFYRIIEETPRNDSGFDCIVPSSGGKDSHWQVLKMIEAGLRPLVVTATTCHLTETGKKNIENLARYATTIEVSPNKSVRARLNRLGLTMVGDISWPEHISIFSTPFRVACQLGIPLIWYGENPQEAYGGPLGTDEAREMTRRWISEFGGFLGLRTQDLVGIEGITERDMTDYKLPTDEEMRKVGVTARFLGQYFFWDSQRNLRVSRDAGMIQTLPCRANWWNGENLDNAQTGIHDALMYRKYKYGRGCAQISVDVRAGLITRDYALKFVHEFDGLFPEEYMGVRLKDILSRIHTSREDLFNTMDRFTNWDLHDEESRRKFGSA